MMEYADDDTNESLARNQATRSTRPVARFRTSAGLLLISVTLGSLLTGCQERDSRSVASRLPGESTTPLNDKSQAHQVAAGVQEPLTLHGHANGVHRRRV